MKKLYSYKMYVLIFSILLPLFSVSQVLRNASKGTDPLLVIRVENTINPSFFSETNIQFDPLATNWFDGDLETYFMGGGVDVPQVYTELLDQGYISQVQTNAYPLLTYNREVPLCFYTMLTGVNSFTLKFSNLTSFDPLLTIYFIDKLKNKIIDLKDAQSYSFTSDKINGVSDPKANSRFLIQFILTPPADMIDTLNPDIVALGTTTFCSGDSVLLKVMHTYQWARYQWKNGVVDIPGATKSSYYTKVAGEYTVDAWDAVDPDPASSNSIVLNVNSKPDIAVQTVSGKHTFCTGESVVFTAVSSVQGLTYQWLKDASPIDGATLSTYTANLTGNYSVQVSAGACPSTALNYKVDFINPPQVNLTSQTGKLNLCQGDNLNLLANVTGQDLIYSWKKDNIIITGASTSVINITIGGIYEAIVDNGSCISNSNKLTIDMLPIPVVILKTESGKTAMCPGDSLVLITETTNQNITYLWKKDNIVISGATASNYIAKDKGVFTVIISNTDCSGTSNNLTLDILDLNNATIQTESGKTAICSGDSLKLISSLTSNNFTYTWKKDNSIIQGASNSELIIKEVGAYSLIVNNGSCSSTSNILTIDVQSLPSFTITGGDKICSGQITLLYVMTNDVNLTYKWYNDNIEIPGANTDKLEINEHGFYTAKAFNENCSSVSNMIEVLVFPKPTVSLGKDTIACAENINYVLDAGTGFKSYKWSDGSFSQTLTIDTALIGINKPVNINVTVEDNNGCFNSDTVTVQFNICDTVNVNNISLNDIYQIYPNPSSGVFSIIFTNPMNNTKISILNIQGQTVYNGELGMENGEWRVDMSDAVKGLYFIRIEYNNKIKLSKIILK